MQMNPENVSRALQAMNDLVDLLRLAQGAAQRLETESHAPIFERTESRLVEVRRVRRDSEKLQREFEQYVAEVQGGTPVN